MNQVLMTIHASLLITRPGIDHVSVGQHGPTFVRDVEKIAMALLALVVLERGIGFLSIFFVIILFLEKVDSNVFGTVPGLGIEEVEGVMWGREMAVHTVGHKTLLIIYMRGGLPGIVGKLDLMADSTKLRCCRADHGVVGETEEWKGDDYPCNNEDGGFSKLFHGCVPATLGLS